ncbi:Nucleoside recognition [Vibrio aerogenes CECT 7868]|uniref:Nucleoside recognition n=1 Tax=Vibrio aerogenes CECT 7868 TaxID=1216006 RepID=A0A1M5UGZ8_9VIBR|nr:YjiH family protein [Vibrio aerogenes]SHH62259.1 Nucleoside recognition [Vibrio aerogenes CECT 7868]
MEITVPIAKKSTWVAALKLILFSATGIFFFFIPVELFGQSTILLDHLVSCLRTMLSDTVRIYTLVLIIAGAAYPFVTGQWRSSRTQMVLSALKVTGIPVTLMAFFSVGPAVLFEKDMLPFLFGKLVIPVGLIVPLGAFFLAFLIGYGLLELTGVLLQPVMKPLFRTPGKSAIDAVASFVGSYSIGLLITNKVYQNGQYSAKEAAIIATGFSTVSATFMVIVAKTLGLMSIWNLFFWSTLILTFVVTALSVRLPPLRQMDDHKVAEEQRIAQASRLRTAWKEGIHVAANSQPLSTSILSNLKDSILMTMGILPSIMSVGLLGLLLAKYTPLFDWIGVLFWPFTWLSGHEEPVLVAKAAATGLAEMFLPALLVAKSTFVTKFVVGQVSISSILFFSASIPCILSTDIPLKLSHILLIWYQRTALTIILSTPLAMLIA